MGVIYKLKDEVVHFIISQRQSDPLASCRQLAESASQKFGLHLSKSSVHDVLKEYGIVTPRGRKPKNKFEIPQEKKKQIQVGLSQIKLLPDPVEAHSVKRPNSIDIEEVSSSASEAKAPIPDTRGSSQFFKEIATSPAVSSNDRVHEQAMEISPEYEGAGRIFFKAALWDLGIFSEENIKETDWNYYLTYSKGIRVVLEGNKSFFIDLPLPIERCIREAADGLINNVRPLIVHKVSDESLLKACMDAQAGFKIENISIVDRFDHILLELNNIVEFNRNFMLKNRVFVDNDERNFIERSKSVFFSQVNDNNGVIDSILSLKGFDTTNKDENIVTLLFSGSYDNKTMLQEAVEKLNAMYLYDEQNRLVSVKIF